MDLEKYAAYFHDGELVDIVHTEDHITFFLISAELPEDVVCDIPLNPDRCIAGALKASDLITVMIEDAPVGKPLQMEFDEAEISDLQVSKNRIDLTIFWSNRRPKNTFKAAYTIHVQANQIDWAPFVHLESIMNRMEPPPHLSGHRVGPHYHLLNPTASSISNKYLDKNSRPVAQGSKASRLTPPQRYSGNGFPADTNPLNETFGPVERYKGYFHDGSLIALRQDENFIEFTMVSAEINERDRHKVIPLSPDFRLKGNLKLYGVTNMLLNGTSCNGILKMQAEVADIYNFEIDNNQFDIYLIWENFHPEYRLIGTSRLQINYQNLEWTNQPLREM